MEPERPTTPKSQSRSVKIEENQNSQSAAKVIENPETINLTSDDPVNPAPESKSKFKKFNDDFKNLMKKSNDDIPKATSSFSNIFKRKKKQKMLAELLDQSDTLSNVPSELFEGLQSKENISAMNADDTLVYGLDKAICLWNLVKSSLNKGK